MFDEPRCHARGCKHFQGVHETRPGDESSQVLVCPAYPNGIPTRIAYGRELHLVVQRDQVGKIVFEESGQ